MAIWTSDEQLEWPGPPNDLPMKMPKHFHLIWNHSPLPEVYRVHGAALKTLHPGWGHTMWDDDTIRAWMSSLGHTNMGWTVKLIEDAYKDRDKRQVSDIVRLVVIYLYGGVYLDFDYTPRRNFEPLLGGVPCVLTCPSSRNIANGFIAAEAFDPFIKFCLDHLEENFYSVGVSRQGATHKTGPRFMTQMYKDYLAETGLPGARLLDQKYFYPYTYNRLDRENDDFPEAYAVHRWASKKGDVWQPEIQES